MHEIAVLSDIHLGWEHTDNDEVISELRAVKKEFARKKPELVILNGDLIHEVDEKTDIENIEQIVELFEDGPWELACLPGNHDIKHLNVEQFLDVTWNRTYPYTFEINGLQFVFLNTAGTAEHSNLGKIKQIDIEYLKKLLFKENRKNVCVVTHFLLSYTDSYQEFPPFAHYPEGVFAVNKFTYATEVADNPPEYHLFGHLHYEDMFEDEVLGTQCYVTPPSIDFLTDTVSIRPTYFDVEDGSLEKSG